MDDVRSPALTILAASAAIFLLHESAAVAAPILACVLLAYALEPFVTTLMRTGLPRLAAAALVFFILAIATGSLARVAREHTSKLMADLPQTIIAIQHALTQPASHGEPTAFERIRRAAADFEQAVGTPIAPSASTRGRVVRVWPVTRRFSPRDILANAAQGLTGMGVQAVVMALLTFLLLVTADVFRRKFVRMAGPRSPDRKLTVDVIRAIDRQIQRYLLVRLAISGIVAAATAASLWAVGVNHAVVWGLVAGALNVLPIVGPSIAIALIVLAAFLQFHAVERTLVAGGLATLVAALEGNLLTPWLTSRAGELNTVAVYVSVLFWGWMWNAWGLLLAVPILVAMKAAADHLDPLRPLAELLGE